MMFTEIKKQFRITWKDMAAVYILEVLLILAGLATGVAMYCSDPNGDVMPLGTALSAGLGVVVLLILTVIQFAMHFNLSVTMGTPRRSFFLANMANMTVLHLGALLVWIAISPLETLAWKIFFPNAVVDMGFFGNTSVMLKYGIIVIICELLIGNLCAALWLRFGKIAGAILWILWMALCITGPQILSAGTENPDSFWGKIGAAVMNFVTSMSKTTLAIGGMALALLALAGTYACIRRQEVRG